MDVFIIVGQTLGARKLPRRKLTNGSLHFVSLFFCHYGLLLLLFVYLARITAIASDPAGHPEPLSTGNYQPLETNVADVEIAPR